MKKLIVATVVLTVLTTAGLAFAATETNNIQVLVNVLAVCRITTNAGNVDFITYDTTDPANDDDGSTFFEFRCTRGTPYREYISRTNVMTSGPNNLNYNLYTDAARTITWATDFASAAPQVSPNNAAQRRDVFGRIPALQDAAVGLYTENVVVTIEY